jgi:raffinose/stachyose/melibiose transport system substrate-binding protein
MKLSKMRRTVMATALAAVTALTLTACGSSGPGGAASGDSTAASAWALTGQQKAFEDSFNSWNSANADKTVKVEFFANDAFKQKIRTAIGSGQGPTMVYGWGGGVLKSYVDAKKVEPLDASLTSKYFPAIVANGQVDGKTYAVPNNSVQPVVLYFNKDLLTKAGIDAPPATWDELLADVATLRGAGIMPLSMGGQSKWPELMWLEYLTDRIGGPEVFQAIQDGKPDAWSNPAVIKANTMIQQLVDAGGFADGFSSIATDSNADLALLYTGRAAMILQGSWAYANFKTSAADFLSAGKLGWTTFPTVTDGAGKPTAVVGNPSNFWSVASYASAGQQASATAYLAGGNMNDPYIDSLIAGGGVPPVTGLETKLKASADPEFLGFVYDMSRDAPSFQLSWDQALTPGQADPLLTNLDQIFLKQMTPQQFSDAMNATIGK